MKKEIVVYREDPKILRVIDALAKKAGASRAVVIRSIIRDGLRQQFKKK